jgi:hypothetical protein
MLRETLNYDEWMKLRYSAGSNAAARRLMLRAFGTDNHGNVLKATRAMSLSDCYWLKEQKDDVLFNEVTPYLHKEWDGTGNYGSGSLSTLFVNGNANKRWLDSKTLLKEGSYKEMDAYALCAALELEKYAGEASLSDKGLLVSNFTATSRFLESLEQSGYVGEHDDARSKAVELFREQAVALLVVDYLVESDDRHWGNIGFLRNTETGEYLGMAPYYDFDWIWTDGVVRLPDNALEEYSGYIRSLCEKAKEAAIGFERKDIIRKRANELLQQLA